MKLLVVDKTALLRNNRMRYNLLSEDCNIELTLLTTNKWIENTKPFLYEKSTTKENYKTIVGKVWMHGHAMLAGYYSGMIKAFYKSQPEIILLLEESFSIFALQTIFLAKIFSPTSKIIFYNWHILSYRYFPHKLGFLYRFMGTALAGMCDVGLSHLPKSKQALDDARSGVRSLIMFQGLNNSPFTNNLITKAEGRLKLNLTKDSIYFLYVGRLLEPKGIQYAINAIHDLRLELNLDLRMIILGEGDFKNELVKLANELSISKFINFFSSVKIEQVPLFMRSADCLILPSKSTIHEQFGRVIAEAMFSGTFVIGSTSGEIPNAIGEDGFVFIADNLQDLKIKICNFIFNKGEVHNIIKNAKVNSIKKYSVNSFVEKLKSLLNELI